MASEAAEDEVLDTSVGVEAPKEAERAADGDAAVPQDPAQHIRELRPSVDYTKQFSLMDIRRSVTLVPGH